MLPPLWFYDMKTLAFDTSTRYMSIACLEGNAVKAEFHEDAGIRHSEILVPTIKNMLDQLGWDIGQIGLFCVGLGPGSFTGLRIAAATVKAFAISVPAKVVGVPSFDAIAFNAPPGENVIAPFLNAHKGKVYSCIYEFFGQEMTKKSDYLLVTVEELLGGLDGEVFFLGDGIARYKKELDGNKLARYDEGLDWYPRAARIALLGLERAGKGLDDPETIEPLYLHPKECDVSEDVMRKMREMREKKQ